jgi:hypothetical protein
LISLTQGLDCHPGISRTETDPPPSPNAAELDHY